MVPIIIAAVALGLAGAAGAIGAAGAAIYRNRVNRQSEVTQPPKKKVYDAVVHIDRESLKKRAYNAPSQSDFFKKRFLLVAMVGFFKTGKTFHLNRLFRLDLPVIVNGRPQVTNGTSIVGAPTNIAGGDVLLLDCAGKDCAFSGANDPKLAKQAKEVDDLTLDVAMSLSDAIIVCVDKVGLEAFEFIKGIQKTIESMKIPGFDKLVVLHNYKDIDSAEYAMNNFQTYVIEPFCATKVQQTIGCGEGYVTNEYWLSQFDDLQFLTLHFLLGREGTEAGKKFNNSA